VFERIIFRWRDAKTPVFLAFSDFTYLYVRSLTPAIQVPGKELGIVLLSVSIDPKQVDLPTWGQIDLITESADQPMISIQYSAIPD